MKKKKLFQLIICIGSIIFVISGCAKKAGYTSDITMSSESSASQFGNGENKTDMASGMESPQDTASSESFDSQLTSTSAITTKESAVNSQDKIIRRANLEVETQDFDNLIKFLDTQINQLGGYVENSEISGRYYYNSDMRYGNIIARVPNDKLDEFINKVYDNSNVVNKQESTENITLQYVDTQSHKKALEIEQERLLALLEKVETLEDIITLETRLSSVRYELQSYETQLRTYDNLVDYSTVTLNIQEVERMTTVIEEEKTVWNRIHTGFGDTMYNLSEGLKNFVVWFIVNLPYLIIWTVIIVIIALISRKYYKKSKSNSNPPIKASITDSNEIKK